MESLITIISRSIKEQKDKVAFSDENEEESYSLFGDRIKRIGSFLLEHQAKTVCILLNKSIKVVNCMFGCVLARATYIVLDANSPEDRLKKIVDAIHPSILLYEDKTKDLGEKLFNGKTSGLASYSFASEHYVNRILLNKAQEESLPSDLIYILFTSGSTGTPKGVMITQENIISYMGWFVKCFNINSKTVFGNQTPFYFSMSVSDVYSTLFAERHFILFLSLVFLSL
jgi:D-alanine--poly(phosphoribitol) ligase subunit 1